MTNLIPAGSMETPSPAILIFDSVSGTLLTRTTIFTVASLERLGTNACVAPVVYCRFLSTWRAITIRWISLVPS